jgi:exonuclease III
MIEAVVDSEIHPEFWGSDHCPVSITINLSKIDLQSFAEY